MAELSPGAIRRLRRWHFTAGLLVAPVLLVLAATGGLYLFDREFHAWWNRAAISVTPQGAPLALGAQEAAVRAAQPAGRIANVVLPWAADEASEWRVDLPDGTQASVFVDPYRARVTGVADVEAQPLALARRLHAGLMLEPAGRYAVEIAASWTLGMLMTGLILWLPRVWRGDGGVLPRRGAARAVVLRDTHALTMALAAIFLGFFVLTGMPWSVFWGARVSELGLLVPAFAPSPQFGAPEPVAGRQPGGPGAGHGHPGEARGSDDALPWAMRHMPEPAATPGPRVGIDVVARQIGRLDLGKWGPGVVIIYPQTPDGVFRVAHLPDKAEGQRSIFVDPGSGEVLRDTGWADYSPLAKIIEWGVQTHLGREYGAANQAVNLAVCVAVAGGIIAALLRLSVRGGAAPPVLAQDRLPKRVFLPLAVIGTIFPLAGASAVAGWAGGRLWRWVRGR